MKLNRFYKNSLGIGLIEVMVGVAISGGLALTMAKMMENNSEGAKVIEAKSQNTTFNGQLQSYLGSPQGCANTFGPLVTQANVTTLMGSTANTVTVPVIRNRNGTPVFDTSSTNILPLTITSMVLTNYNDADDTADLRVTTTYRKSSKMVLSTKPVIINLSFQVNNTIPATPTLTTCVALSGGGNLGAWQDQSSPALGIFYNMGSVLIGSGTANTSTLTPAFAAGTANTATGLNSIAMGNTTIASGINTVAMGRSVTASGNNSFAFGDGITTVMTNATANSFATRFTGGYRFYTDAGATVGLRIGANGGLATANAIASGTNSVATGDNSTASGTRAVAMGDSNVASGANSVALGSSNTVSGMSSVALGSSNTSNGGSSSVALGASNTASGVFAIAMGSSAVSSGSTSIAIGSSALSSGSTSVAIGASAQATANNAFAFGASAQATATGAFTLNDSSWTALNNNISNSLKGRFDNGLTFYTDTAHAIGNAFLVTPTGNVGIGLGNPSYKLHVMGDINASGSVRAAGVVLTSDIRLKEKLMPVKDSLQRLSKLNAYNYYWKDKKTNNDQKQLGLVAQEVEKVFPEAVQKGQDGFLAVAYSNLVAPLIEAVKELFNMSESHAKEIAKLKHENAAMKARLERLEKVIESQNRIPTSVKAKK